MLHALKNNCWHKRLVGHNKVMGISIKITASPVAGEKKKRKKMRSEEEKERQKERFKKG